MQIVVHIEDSVYHQIKQHGEISEFHKLIIHGIPLPKGHGTLKDTDAICKDIISELGIRDENYLLEAEEAVYRRIKNAPTIIEADKTGSEDQECEIYQIY